MKIAWVWLDSEDRFVRLQELTPEETLLRSVEAPNYGADIETVWEECSRREFQEEMERRNYSGRNGPDQPGDVDETP